MSPTERKSEVAKGHAEMQRLFADFVKSAATIEAKYPAIGGIMSVGLKSPGSSAQGVHVVLAVGQPFRTLVGISIDETMQNHPVAQMMLAMAANSPGGIVASGDDVYMPGIDPDPMDG